MTSDERIEALTQSVEIISRMHQDNEVRFQGCIDRLTGVTDHLVGVVDKITAVVESLATIAHDHDARIRNLENRIQ